ncbi:MAG: hypothetical protein ACYSSN_01580, partial [Planctomycetota bacterium]
INTAEGCRRQNLPGPGTDDTDKLKMLKGKVDVISKKLQEEEAKLSTQTPKDTRHADENIRIKNIIKSINV